ncbi:sigma 54-interacting transcriptional regulator [uncultured Desulfobacter sp.]|uniref:sigma 54-interacting transcriptional regulator n=1 Tax=uncultured Desulfobacter sp. TaxID=240139 RepID=UPI002AA8B25D|nr:sigma 54-interacting transcriptional regulator [uncultured Desulfobacter sp.]
MGTLAAKCGDIETRNPSFNNLIEQIERVAINSVDPVLITGPTGAGKSRLARRVYELKKARRQLKGCFVEVNCATLRGDGAMSALFGHKKGSFTGATSDRDGLLKTADNGMLFLDEVGELGLDEQSMLLRAVEEKHFLPVGSDNEAHSDFQLICGTNRDLFQDVMEKRFREDLLSRINLWTFEMPGLNKRPEDIEPNLNYELDRFAERTKRHITFNKEARNRFLKFATAPEALWPANFRDLNGAVTRMATLAPGGRITGQVVKDEIHRLSVRWGSAQKQIDDGILA